MYDGAYGITVISVMMRSVRIIAWVRAHNKQLRFAPGGAPLVIMCHSCRGTAAIVVAVLLIRGTLRMLPARRCYDRAMHCITQFNKDYITKK